MAKPKVVELFSRDGETTEYRLFSQRLPEFMEKYPAKDGWRIERDAVSAVSLVPELVSLHTAAIAAGKSPPDLGLPPLPRGYIFRCRLLDHNNAVIRTASTLAMVRDFDMAPPAVAYSTDRSGYKDWETAETNAFQRLVASMGFDGSTLDADEGRATTTAASTSEVTGAVIPVVEVEDDNAVEEAADEAAGSSNGAAPKRTVVPVGARAPNADQLFTGLKRQVEMLAKQQGVAVPEVKNAEDCKRALTALIPTRKQ